MDGESPAGNGLQESAKPCQECECEHGVIAYHGNSLCQCCLAGQGVYRSPFGEAAAMASAAVARARSAAAVQTQNDIARRLANEATAESARVAAVQKTPAKQIDSARLMKRRRVAGV